MGWEGTGLKLYLMSWAREQVGEIQRSQRACVKYPTVFITLYVLPSNLWRHIFILSALLLPNVGEVQFWKTLCSYSCPINTFKWAACKIPNHCNGSPNTDSGFVKLSVYDDPRNPLMSIILITITNCYTLNLERKQLQQMPSLNFHKVLVKP